MRSVSEGHPSIESLPSIATEVSSTLRSSRYSEVVRLRALMIPSLPPPNMEALRLLAALQIRKDVSGGGMALGLAFLGCKVQNPTVAWAPVESYETARFCESELVRAQGKEIALLRAVPHRFMREPVDGVF